VRNRCKDYVGRINEPGSAEWTIKKWEEKWRGASAGVDPSLSDRILAAKYLAAIGRYYTISLFDRDVLIGGATMTVHKRDIVAGVLYFDPPYRKDGVGDRLIDLSFSLAMEKDFETFDIGGGHEYKKHWAKQDGERWWFHICPEPIYRVREFIQWGRKTIRRGSAGQEQEPSATSVN
jgi:GNAT superfamily N-acetyltransferase